MKNNQAVKHVFRFREIPRNADDLCTRIDFPQNVVGILQHCPRWIIYVVSDACPVAFAEFRRGFFPG